jgi:hypothetical protein
MKVTLGSCLVKVQVKIKSRVISHAQRWVSKPRSGLAGVPAGDDGRCAAGGPETDGEKQGEDGGGSDPDRPKKAENKLSKGHAAL